MFRILWSDLYEMSSGTINYFVEKHWPLYNITCKFMSKYNTCKLIVLINLKIYANAHKTSFFLKCDLCFEVSWRNLNSNEELQLLHIIYEHNITLKTNYWHFFMNALTFVLFKLPQVLSNRITYVDITKIFDNFMQIS